MRVYDVELMPKDILGAIGCKSLSGFLRKCWAGELDSQAMEDAARDLRDMALSGGLEHGRVLEYTVTKPARDPSGLAFELVDLERDAAISKGDLAEMTHHGIHEHFRKSFERRESAYMDQLGLGFESAHWAALNDLCSAAGDQGRYARRIRALRVRACLHNAAVTGRPAPRVGRRP